MSVVSYILQCGSCKIKGKTDTFSDKYSCPKCHGTMYIFDVVLADNHGPVRPFLEELLKKVSANDPTAKKQFKFIADSSSAELRDTLDSCYYSFVNKNAVPPPRSQNQPNPPPSPNHCPPPAPAPPPPPGNPAPQGNRQCWLCLGRKKFTWNCREWFFDASIESSGHADFLDDYHDLVCPLCRGSGMISNPPPANRLPQKTIFNKNNLQILVYPALEAARFYFDLTREAMIRAAALKKGAEDEYWDKLIIILYFFWLTLKLHTENQETDAKLLSAVYPDTVVQKYKIAQSSDSWKKFTSQYESTCKRYNRHMMNWDKWNRQLPSLGGKQLTLYQNKIADARLGIDQEERNLLENLTDLIAFIENRRGKDLKSVARAPDPAGLFLIHEGSIEFMENCLDRCRLRDKSVMQNGTYSYYFDSFAYQQKLKAEAEAERLRLQAEAEQQRLQAEAERKRQKAEAETRRKLKQTRLIQFAQTLHGYSDIQWFFSFFNFGLKNPNGSIPSFLACLIFSFIALLFAPFFAGWIREFLPMGGLIMIPTVLLAPVVFTNRKDLQLFSAACFAALFFSVMWGIRIAPISETAAQIVALPGFLAPSVCLGYLSFRKIHRWEVDVKTIAEQILAEKNTATFPFNIPAYVNGLNQLGIGEHIWNK